MSSQNPIIITRRGHGIGYSYEDVTQLEPGGPFRRLLEEVNALRRVLTNNLGFVRAFLGLLDMIYYVEHSIFKARIRKDQRSYSIF